MNFRVGQIYAQTDFIGAPYIKDRLEERYPDFLDKGLPVYRLITKLNGNDVSYDRIIPGKEIKGFKTNHKCLADELAEHQVVEDEDTAALIVLGMIGLPRLNMNDT
jgi:hypothetical protein